MRVSQNGLNSLLVTWTPFEAHTVTGYIIHYEYQKIRAKHTQTSVTIIDLMTGVTYSIRVVANSHTLPSSFNILPNVPIRKYPYNFYSCQLLISFRASQYFRQFIPFTFSSYGWSHCHSQLLPLSTQWNH